MSNFCADCMDSEVLRSSRCDTASCPKKQAEEKQKQIQKLEKIIQAQKDLHCRWCKEKSTDVCCKEKCKTAYIVAKCEEGIDELKTSLGQVNSCPFFNDNFTKT